MARCRLLLIGLDAAEPSCVERWIAEGRLPAIAGLRAVGAWTPLRSPAEEFPDEVWPSLYASSNAARIGKYYYIQPERNSNNLALLEDNHQGKQFWTVASEAGKRCAVIDPPKTAMLPGINGVQVANWGAHATRCEMQSEPPELIADILAKHGEYPLHTCDNHGRSPADYRKLRDDLIAGVHKRGALLRDMLEREEWDLFFGAFSETHCAGHQFWHFQDPTHPLYDPDDRHGLRSAMADVYAAVDEEIGSLLALVGRETPVVIFSGHGMAPQFHGRDLVAQLLSMWGMDRPENTPPDPSTERRVEVKPGFVQWLKEAVPIQLQYVVKSLLPKRLESAVVARVMGSKSLDPNARVNYVPNNDLNPAFRVNLKGRDPNGLVEPGAEYDAVLDFLTERLEQLVNPATGKPAIRKVSRLHERYEGPNLDLLPDLTAMWSREAWISEVHSPGYGTVVGSHRDLRTGGHDAMGFCLLQAPGRAAAIEGAEPTGKDIGPTVLTLLGVPVPETMEGRSLIRSGAPARL